MSLKVSFVNVSVGFQKFRREMCHSKAGAQKQPNLGQVKQLSSKWKCGELIGGWMGNCFLKVGNRKLVESLTWIFKKLILKASPSLCYIQFNKVYNFNKINLNVLKKVLWFEFKSSECYFWAWNALNHSCNIQNSLKSSNMNVKRSTGVFYSLPTPVRVEVIWRKCSCCKNLIKLSPAWLPKQSLNKWQIRFPKMVSTYVCCCYPCYRTVVLGKKES